MTNSKWEEGLSPVKKYNSWEEGIKPLKKKEYNIKSPEPSTGIKGIAEDVVGIPGKVIDYAMGIPEKSPESWYQIATDPVRALKNFAAGAGETVLNTAYSPITLGKYLSKKGIPGFGLANKIPEIPNLGIEEAMGLGEQKPGDELIRQMFMFAPIGAKNPTGGIKTFVKEGPFNTRRKFKKAKKEAEEANKKLSSTKEQFSPVMEEENTSQAEKVAKYEALKNFLEQHEAFGTANPNTLQRRANIGKATQEELADKLSQTPEHLRVTEEPETPELTKIADIEREEPNLTDIEDIEKPKPKTENIKNIPRPYINEERVPQAERLLKTAEQKAAEKETQLQTHLGKGEEHGRKLANYVTNTTKELKKEVGSIYENEKEALKSKNVVLPRQDEITTLENNLRKSLEDSKAVKDSEIDTMVAKASEKLKKQAGSDIIPASDFISNFRSIRKISQKVRDSAYKTGLTEDERGARLKHANELDKQVESMEDVIEKQDLGEEWENIKKANKRWREEVIPIVNNDVYRTMARHGHVSSKDLMYELRGTRPGNDIIKNMIKKEPEMVRRIIGMKHAEKPEGLHKFHELTSEFTPHASEEFHKLRQEHFEAGQETEKAKHALSEAEKKYQQEKELANKEHAIAKENAKERNMAEKERVEKEHKETKKLAKQQNESAKKEALEKHKMKQKTAEEENKRLLEEYGTKSEHYKNYQRFNKLTNEIADLEKYSKAAKKAAIEARQHKGTGLKEIMSLEKVAKEKAKAFNEAKTEWHALRSTLIKLGFHLAGWGALAEAGHKIGVY